MNNETSPANDPGAYRPDWFCPQCGSRNDGANTQCQTCKEVGNEINSDFSDPQPPTAQDVARGRSITRAIVLIFALCAVGACYTAYKGFTYLQAQTHLEKAYTLHQKGEIAKAIESYNKVLEHEPDNAWALSNRASAFFYIGDFEGSERDYTRAIDLGEKSAEHYGYRGTTRMLLGKYRAAILDYELAKMQHPHDHELVRGIMHSQYNLGDLDGALANADKLFAVEATKADALFMRAYVAWEREDLPRAEEFMRSAVAANPAYTDAYVWLALVLLKEKPAEAEELWKKAFQLKDPADMYLNLAYGEYLMLEKKENGDAYFEKVLAQPAIYTEDVQDRYVALCALGRAADAETLVPRLEKAAAEARWQQVALATGQLFLARKSSAEAKARYHDKAVDYLEKAKALGLKDWKDADNDWLLPDLKEHPRYQKLIAAP